MALFGSSIFLFLGKPKKAAKAKDTSDDRKGLIDDHNGVGTDKRLTSDEKEKEGSEEEEKKPNPM